MVRTVCSVCFGRCIDLYTWNTASFTFRQDEQTLVVVITVADAHVPWNRATRVLLIINHVKTLI